MSRSFDAVVAGHICLDIIPTITDPRLTFQPGRLLEVGPAILSTGGCVSNTGLALHKLGIRTRLMGKTGADIFGQAIRKIVAGHDPDLVEGMIEVKDETSSYTIILSPPELDRMFLHCPGCNDTFAADDIDYEMVAAARLFHFGYPPLLKRTIERDGAELTSLFQRAKATGVTTSLDMSMPDPRALSGRVNWPLILSTTLPYVDIYLPSLEETLFTLYPARFREICSSPDNLIASIRANELSSICRDLLAMGPFVVGLKLGPLGFYLKTGDNQSRSKVGRAFPRELSPWLDRELWSPCFETRVAGTTGAGDATIAGFLAAMLRDRGPEECATMACAVGACNVEAADAISGIRSWNETRQRLQAGWPRKGSSSPEADWCRSAETGVWNRR